MVVGRFQANDPLAFVSAAAAMLDAHVRIDGEQLILEGGPTPWNSGLLFAMFNQQDLWPSIRLLEAKQKLIRVTADRRVEYIFGVIVGLVRKN
jgi:hypothetical protein